ncbi:MAG: hypothetical protein ACK4FL_02035 [Microgenomates group bacterium]
MIGDKYNNKLKNKKSKNSGQVLLITIMLLATALTLVLSLSFKSTSETQITKLEEESQKALAAAEAGLEKSIRSSIGGSFASLGLNLEGINLTESNVTFETTQKNTFTTPLLQKDEAYTFYISNYDPTGNNFGPSTAQNVTVCFQGSSPNPALEITLIKSNSIKRYVVDPDGRINLASTPSSCSSNSSFSYSFTIPGSDVGTDAKVLVVRILYNGGKLFFSRTANFPFQGKTITSQAKSETGVTKKIQLFQSYPQIPSDFFVTSF